MKNDSRLHPAKCCQGNLPFRTNGL